MILVAGLARLAGISPRSYTYKNFLCIHMRKRAGPLKRGSRLVVIPIKIFFACMRKRAGPLSGDLAS